jgi:hypothetical protein
MRELGMLWPASHSPATASPLSSQTTQNLTIHGPITSTKEHLSCAALDLRRRGQSWEAIDAYRLIEIFLEKDAEYSSQAPITEADLAIIFLGFGDPRNKYLPELLQQVLARRELENKATWVVLGLPPAQIAGRYGADLAEKLSQYRAVAA